MCHQRNITASNVWYTINTSESNNTIFKCIKEVVLIQDPLCSSLGHGPDTIPIVKAFKGFQRTSLAAIAIGAHQAFAANAVTLVFATANFSWS